MSDSTDKSDTRTRRESPLSRVGGYPISSKVACSWTERVAGITAGSILHLYPSSTVAIVGELNKFVRENGGTGCYTLSNDRFLIGTRLRQDQWYGEHEENLAWKDRFQEGEKEILAQRLLLRMGIEHGEFMTIRT